MEHFEVSISFQTSLYRLNADVSRGRGIGQEVLPRCEEEYMGKDVRQRMQALNRSKRMRSCSHHQLLESF